MEDEALVEQIRRGNREAFRLVVLRYQRPLFRFLGLLGFDASSCEDLAQQTFLSAFRALAEFDPSRARFSTWLFTIAKRHASHERERAHHRRETPATEATDALSRSEAPDPAEAAALAERVRLLDAALGSLPEELRSTFLLSQIKRAEPGRGGGGRKMSDWDREIPDLPRPRTTASGACDTGDLMSNCNDIQEKIARDESLSEAERAHSLACEALRFGDRRFHPARSGAEDIRHLRPGRLRRSGHGRRVL